MTTKQKSKASAAVEAALSTPETRINKIITVANQKGGAGKTSTCVNVAHFLNELGYRVLAIDLDGQGNLSECFFSSELLERTSYTGSYKLFEIGGLENYQPLHHASGIDVLASRARHHELGGVDAANFEQVAEIFYDNLEKLDGLYDFVLFDTPPTQLARSTLSYMAADYIFAPVNGGTFSISALIAVLESHKTISDMMAKEPAPVSVLINNILMNTEAGKAKYAQLCEVIPNEMLVKHPIRTSQSFVSAQEQGLPVWHLNKTGASRTASVLAIEAYGELVGRIAEVDHKRIENFKEVSRAVRASRIAEIKG